MTFLSPWLALGVGGVAIPLLVLMYFLKLRRKAMTVSSTLLWRRSIQDIQVNSPFQKLKRNWLLLLQLLVMAAILLAIARPTLRRQATLDHGQRLILVIDRSASMSATDETPTRLDKAKRLALERLESFDGGQNARVSGGIMVISLADRAQVVQPMTQDRTQVRRAIESISPSDQSSSLSAALELIQPYLVSPATPGSSTSDSGSESQITKNPGVGGAAPPSLGGEVDVYSDGRFADVATDRPSLSGSANLRVIYHPIGQDEKSLDNLGIVAISARRDPEHPSKLQVLARLLNSSSQSVAANLSLQVDGRVRLVKAVSVAAWQQQAVTFDLTLHGSALLTVKHDHADQLASDDQASLNLAPPRTLRVALVSDTPNPFLDHALKACGLQKLTRWSGKEYEDQDPQRLRRTLSLGREEGYDLLVFDRYSPKNVPPVSSLSFACAPPVPGLELQAGNESDGRALALLDWDRDDPLLRYVSLDDVLFVSPGRWVLPATARRLAQMPSGPVLAQVTYRRTAHVMASFDPLKSNWPMQIGFAVFIRNALEQLSASSLWSQGVQYHPGQVVWLPTATDRSQPLVYSLASSNSPTSVPVIPETASANGGVWQADRVGVYQSQAKLAPPWDRLAVNLSSELESDLRPAPTLTIGQTAATTVSTAGDGWIRQEIWRWLAMGAIGLLMLEWLVYCRRLHA